jgi:hypothetical protein
VAVVVPVLPPPSPMLSAWFALLVAVSSYHHLPCRGDITPSSPLTNTQEDKADSPLHPSNADDDNAADNNVDNNAADDDADDNADVNADNNSATQMTDDNTDAMQRR